MQYVLKVEIPDGKYCLTSELLKNDPITHNNKVCRFLVGEIHSMCFLEDDDLEDDEVGVIKHEKCPCQG
jgi:hypothetical protein